MLMEAAARAVEGHPSLFTVEAVLAVLEPAGQWEKHGTPGAGRHGDQFVVAGWALDDVSRPDAESDAVSPGGRCDERQAVSCLQHHEVFGPGRAQVREVSLQATGQGGFSVDEEWAEYKALFIHAETWARVRAEIGNFEMLTVKTANNLP